MPSGEDPLLGTEHSAVTGERMRTAHLAVEVSGFGRHPQAWRQAGVPREALLTPAHHIAAVQLAAQSGADLVALPDSFGPDHLLDAVAIAFGSSLIMSNEVRGKLRITLRAGRALLLARPETHLPSAG